MSHWSVCRWVSKFNAGQKDLRAVRSGRPPPTTTKSNIKKIIDLLNQDARYTVKDLARLVTFSLARVLGILTHSPIHHFETVPNSKKLQTTTEMWLFKDFNRKYCGKRCIAQNEQFHLFPQCSPRSFLINVLKRVYMEKRDKKRLET